MDHLLFNKLAASPYADHASFAIWAEDITDLSVIPSNIPILNASIAIIGLNPSGAKRDKMEGKFRGFHCRYRGCRDGFLRTAFQDETDAFRGAYMTDIVPTDPSTTQDVVSVQRSDLVELATELDFIGFFDHKDPLVIALGDKAYAALTGHLNSAEGEFHFQRYVNSEYHKQIRIEKLSHHARRGYSQQQYVSELQQLIVRLRAQRIR